MSLAILPVAAGAAMATGTMHTPHPTASVAFVTTAGITRVTAAGPTAAARPGAVRFAHHGGAATGAVLSAVAEPLWRAGSASVAGHRTAAPAPRAVRGERGPPSAVA